MSQMATVEQEFSRSAVAAVASLAPLYALLAMKQTRLRLDNLHVVLAQLLVLSVLRFAINLSPRRVAKAATAIEAKVVPATKGDATAPNETVKKRRRGQKKVLKKGENAKYSYATMDTTLYRFLSIVDPQQLDKLGPLPPGSPKPPEKVALTNWKEMHRAHGLVVLQHPQMSMMYAICYRFQGVEMRNLWEILVDITKRPSWDGLCEKAEQLEELGAKGSVERPKQRVGSVSWMAMKGMFPVKAKDLVLLSVVAHLPSSPSTIPETPDKPVTRLVCATTTTESERKPAGSGYQRMELDISGFVLEEDGEGGTLLTQITDLSGLGSWVPTKIISLVTQTMAHPVIPKSLARIGRRAKELKLEGVRAQVKGDDWLPPELGIWRDQSEGEVEAVEEEANEDVHSDDDLEPDNDDVELSSSTLSDLVAQLRTLTARLSVAEARRNGRSNSAGGLGGFFARIAPSNGGVQVDSPSMSLIEYATAAALGGAASALTFWTLATAWSKRR